MQPARLCRPLLLIIPNCGKMTHSVITHLAVGGTVFPQAKQTFRIISRFGRQIDVEEVHLSITTLFVTLRCVIRPTVEHCEYDNYLSTLNSSAYGRHRKLCAKKPLTALRTYVC